MTVNNNSLSIELNDLEPNEFINNTSKKKINNTINVIENKDEEEENSNEDKSCEKNLANNSHENSNNNLSDNTNENSNNNEIDNLSDNTNDDVYNYSRNTNYFNNSNNLNELTLKTEKEFDKHLQDKLKKLDLRLKLLQKKYHKYKTWYDKLNIMIIIISSFLSIIEALRNELDNIADDSEIWTILFNMIPLSISTFITGTVAIIKFQKYQEKMENMQFTKEKVILAISKIKHIQELIKFSKPKEFEEVKKKYFNDIYTFYNESNSELERQLKSV